jgi:hypothetical protein
MSLSLKSSKNSAFSAKEVSDVGITLLEVEPKKDWAAIRGSDDNELSILDTDTISLSPGLDDISTCATPSVSEVPDSCILFVSDLSNSCGVDDLNGLFSSYGEVINNAMLPILF